MSNLSQEGQRAYQEYRQETGTTTQTQMNPWKESGNGFEGAAYDQLSVEYKQFLERKDMKTTHEDPFDHKQYIFGGKINPDGGARAWRKESTGTGTGQGKTWYMDVGIIGCGVTDADGLLKQNESSYDYRWKILNALTIQKGVGATDVLCIVLKQKKMGS